MGTRLRKIAEQSLFSKIFIVMVISIISITILTSWVTVQMSKKLFVQTFSITNSKIIDQIKSGLESFHYSNVNIAINTAQSAAIRNYLTGPEMDSLTSYSIVYSMEEQMHRIQSGIGAKSIGILLLGGNGKSYVSDRAYWSGSPHELQQNPITQSTLSQPGKLLYSFMKPEAAGCDEACLVASKALYIPGSEQIYGTLYMMIRESEFNGVYNNFTSTGNDVMILDQSGVIVSSNRTELIGTVSDQLLTGAKTLEQTGGANLEMAMIGKDVIVLADYLPLFDFYIVNVIDKNMVLGHMLNTKAIVLICTGIVAAAVLLVYFITRRLTKSLRTLVKKMSNVTKNNFNNYMTVSGTYETRELSNSFNYMLDELNDYISRLVETQKEQRRAELAALQQQINPHFLYNTLASVNILVQRGSNDQATETIHALISLLQNTISNVKETITVEQELQSLKHYVFINQVRYGRGIKVDYFVSPDCLTAQVPKLMLQPFIENAFFHAFNKKHTGYIYVIITRDRETLVCEVVDNGDGMELAPSEETTTNPAHAKHPFTGIGIRNVHDRLLLLYGKEYGVSMESGLGQGTKITIRIPWLTDQRV
ncbi:sensor histidine kinase [Paenibacillus sp. GCM10023248]|uniref:cache domain-containing sensor histidine kinase n=1 Tax=Bacillales TaxID=1385 RepID=UPI0023788123|nr:MULTISPECIES: sensor histidine kinase [Bacillales]MDD9265414.1 sensor histidine kinase [Paenibacillus sp. MAHUQ-63]MDR6882555.1 two-component system sensor histidine kinase YesM [Bacillus sp. 3255]